MNAKKFILSLLALCSINNLCSQRHDNDDHVHTAHKHTADTHTTDITTASPAYRFEFEFSALFLKPMASNLHYVVEAIPLPLPSPNWNIYDIKSDYHFGFNLALASSFHSLDSKLRINWERLHTSDCAFFTTTSNSSNMVGPFFEIGPDAQAYKNALGKNIFHFDEVNLIYGQNINIGPRLHSSIFAGISFARINQTLTSTYANFAGTITRTIPATSFFKGAGPQIGLDFSYDVVCGLELTGQAAIALLTGSLKNYTAYASTTPLLSDLGITPPNQQSTSTPNLTQLVPAFNQKIGLAYVHEFCEHYLVKIAAGYQSQIYLNALQMVDLSSEVPNLPTEISDWTVGVFARTFQRNLSNFALAGPYLTLEVGF